MDINDIRNAARKTSVDESSYYLDWYYGLRDAIETIDAHYLAAVAPNLTRAAKPRLS